MINRRPQGVASLCPGLSPYAPLGLGEDDLIARGLSPGLLFGGAARLNRCGVYSHSPRLAPRRLTGSITCRWTERDLVIADLPFRIKDSTHRCTTSIKGKSAKSFTSANSNLKKDSGANQAPAIQKAGNYQPTEHHTGGWLGDRTTSSARVVDRNQST